MDEDNNPTDDTGASDELADAREDQAAVYGGLHDQWGAW